MFFGAQHGPRPPRSQEESGLVTRFCGCTAPLSRLPRLSRHAVSKDLGFLSFQCRKLPQRKGFWESFRSSLADFRCRPLTALSSAASEAQALVVCTGFNFPASDRASCSSIFAEITCNRATSGARFWWPNVAQVHFSTFKNFKKSKSTCQQNGPSAKALRLVPQACWNHEHFTLFMSVQNYTVHHHPFIRATAKASCCWYPPNFCKLGF